MLDCRGLGTALAIAMLGGSAAAYGQVTAPTATQVAAPFAQHPTNPARAPAIRQARELIEAFMARRGVPGLSIAISREGVMQMSEGFGLADVEQGVPVTPATRFRSGSTAKPISMTAAARLHDMGKLDFDAPVQTLVPTFPVKPGKPITFRMLAGMTAGLRHYRLGTDDYFSTKRYDDVLDYVKTFQDEPLLSPPGTKFFYSSLATNLQGAMTQAAGGKPFPGLVQELVFAPLGMVHTSADRNEDIIPNRTRYYERTGGERTYRIRTSSWGPEGKPERGVLLNAPYSDNSNKFPAGGYLTTPEDLVKFGNAHLQPGFLKAETLKELFTPQKTADGKPTGYGLNWFVEVDQGGNPIWYHPGASVGGNSIVLVYPRQRVVLAMQTNLSDSLATLSEMRELPQQLARLFLP